MTGAARRDSQQYPHGDLTEEIIGAIIEVHRHLGSGYLESTYEAALVRELTGRGLRVERQKTFKVFYKDAEIGEHRADIIVNRLVLLELKAVEELAPVHKAQVISTLKAAGLEIGLLVNFNEVTAARGIRRVIFSAGATA